MQWNQLTLDVARRPDVRGTVGADAWVYFVHSLHAVPEDPAAIAATCTTAAWSTPRSVSGNVFATQFHPEKSGAVGLALLGNFVRIAAEKRR